VLDRTGRNIKIAIMNLAEFNAMEHREAKALLATTCGSGKWQELMMQHFPFESERSLVKIACDTWYDQLEHADWMEAFAQHPKIGDIKSLTEKFAATSHLAGKEQAAINNATDEVIMQLAKANELYETKFGFIFIVFATGKTAPEMLRILYDRIVNMHDEELVIAMGEQLKITIQRFKNILADANWQSLDGSQVTTHVLDTSLGKPAKNMSIRLKHFVDGRWQILAQGVSNGDGRLSGLLPSCKKVLPGHYKMHFDTGNYFKANDLHGFYPEVEINFTVLDDTHHHVPLLLNPFGYSTYRGS
jgi:5-hydroxyisourate hydrolase / 2-oxo-4-hydroxy-4-carboxy-5-ureidoimidazoline decarboxylase